MTNDTTCFQKAAPPSDLSEITPFGGLRSECGSILHRNSWKTNRAGSGSSKRWPWINWSHRKESPTNPPAVPTTEDSGTIGGGGNTATASSSKHHSTGGYSLLAGRKRKGRHISCPDISSASSESSRSTSPTSFKASLTSLFHRPQSSPSTITSTSSTTNSAKPSVSTMSRPLVVSGSHVLQRSGSVGKKSAHKAASVAVSYTHLTLPTNREV